MINFTYFNGDVYAYDSDDASQLVAAENIKKGHIKTDKRPSDAHTFDAASKKWVLDSAKQAEIDAQAKAIEAEKTAEERAAAKAHALATIIVTTQSGKVFDGDELAQNRMSRAIQLSDIIGQKKTEWKLADNTMVDVMVDELKEAMLLSMMRTAEIVAGKF